MNRYCFDAAGVSWRFRFEQTALRPILEQRFGAFNAPRSPGYAKDAFDVELRMREVADGMTRPCDLRCVEDNSRHWVFTYPQGRVSLDRLVHHARVDGPMVFQPLDLLVRCGLSESLLARDGLLLHGALVEVGGAAVVLAGESGAGKTTGARHLGDEVWCDECVALCADPTRGSCVASSTPYWGGRPRRVPLAAVLFLTRRRDGASWERLSAGRLASKLVETSGPVSRSGWDRALKNAATVAGMIPVSAAVTLGSIEQISSWLRPRLLNELRRADALH